MSRDALDSAIDECRWYLAQFPGMECLPLHLIMKVAEHGGDALAIEQQLLDEREED